jgi:nicotinamidase-related amidase
MACIFIPVTKSSNNYSIDVETEARNPSWQNAGKQRGVPCYNRCLNLHPGGAVSNLRDPASRILERPSVALAVIDMQEKLLPAIHDSGVILHNSGLLLRLAQRLHIPTLFTTQYAKGLGDIPAEITSLAPGAAAFDKVNFGCFGDERFLPWLKQQSPRATTLLVAGVECHICVAQTVLGALEAGYLVHVAADATGSRAAENRRIGLQRMERAGAVISSTEMMLYELMGQSNTPEFREMLPLLK